MEKLKYLSLVLVVAMCTGFVSCDPEPDPEPVQNTAESNDGSSSVMDGDSGGDDADENIEELIKSNVYVYSSYSNYVRHIKVRSTLHNAISEDIEFVVGHGEMSDGSIALTQQGQSSNSGNTWILEIDNPFWYYYYYGKGADIDVGVNCALYYTSYNELKGKSSLTSGERELYNSCVDYLDRYEYEAKRYYHPSIQVLIDGELYMIEEW